MNCVRSLARLAFLPLVGVLGLAFPSPADSGSLVMDLPKTHLARAHDNACIDWTCGVLYAAGYSEFDGLNEADALAEAYEDAVQRLLSALRDVTVAETITVDKLLALRPSLFMRLYGIASGAFVMADCVRQGQEPGVGVLLALDLTGSGLLPLLVEGFGVGQAHDRLPTPTPPPAESSAEWLSSIRHPTGLIIDARKVPAAPALCPAIYAEDGRLVFNQQTPRRLWFMQHGGCTYMSDLEAARREPKVGVNSMTVEAIGGSPTADCDLVISDEDADRLILLRKRLAFLSECRIVIVCWPQRSSGRSD